MCFCITLLLAVEGDGGHLHQTPQQPGARLAWPSAGGKIQCPGDLGGLGDLMARAGGGHDPKCATDPHVMHR